MMETDERYPDPQAKGPLKQNTPPLTQAGSQVEPRAASKGPQLIVIVAAVVLAFILILALMLRYGILGNYDALAPGAITNLITREPTDTSIELRWTAPGDDDFTGQASMYSIRYSSQPIDSEERWNQARQCPNAPPPEPAGSNQVYVVRNLTQSTTYYFAIKTADEAPNWSPLSNSPNGTTFREVYLVVDLSRSGDGKNWLVTVIYVSSGLPTSEVYLTIYRADGAINLSRTAFLSLKHLEHGVAFNDDGDCIVEVPERLTLRTTWYAVGCRLQISCASYDLANVVLY